jgi:hypothetical protein
MFPKAKGTDIDFDALGQKMVRRKKELMSKGVPAPAEATMVAKSKGNGDSPAKAAQRTRSASSKRGVKAGA